jgi:peroxiredoxin Q/BCP
MVGRQAPEFRLQTDEGAWLSLADLRGQRVVLYFYPKDDTSGCTVEACEFRDLFPRFEADGARVLGVSPDPVARHLKFKAKYGLPFTLLADPMHETCEAYGVWREKLFWGRRYMGVVRTTFVIAPDGRVEHVWEQVDHSGHAAEVSAWLRGEPAPERPTARAKPHSRAAKKK